MAAAKRRIQGENKTWFASLHPVRISLMKKVQFSQKNIKNSVALILAATLTGCSTPPPQNTSDVCEIFRENRSWYKAANAASEKW
ncbi:MAG: hypothetical protein R3177_04860, partial [Arsukibacterium sp.]|nr:hypothetical protein [Arsukibacterium sp.]